MRRNAGNLSNLVRTDRVSQDRTHVQGQLGVTRLVACAIVLVGSAVILDACSSAPTRASNATTRSKGEATTTRSTFPPPPTTTPQTKFYTTSPCSSSQLSVTLGGFAAASNSEGGLLIFTNNGHTSCSMSGYPTVLAEGTQGNVVMTARRTRSGYLGGVTGVSPPQAYLEPGLSASALVEGGALPTGHASCVTITTIVITPPGATASISVPNRFPTGHGVPGCSPISVHPVIPGLAYSDTPAGVTPIGFNPS